MESKLNSEPAKVHPNFQGSYQKESFEPSRLGGLLLP
jgi:hypothetical protein